MILVFRRFGCRIGAEYRCAGQKNDGTVLSAFADEVATIMESAARGRGLKPNSGIVNMAITRKQALKRIEGLIGEGSNAGIESHIAKLGVARW